MREEERATGPKSRRKRKIDTFDEVLGPAFDPSNTSDAKAAAGRAPL
jgi:hypothetical protein